jgi:hypothetical protein
MTEMSNAVDHWCVALEQGDTDEVDRLVMKKHSDRAAVVLSGQMMQMVGGADRRRSAMTVD